MKKKILSIVLVVAFVLSITSANAFATAQTEITEVIVNGLDYPVIGKSLDTDFTIPTQENTYYIADSKAVPTWYLYDNSTDKFIEIANDTNVKYGELYKAVLYLFRTNSNYKFNKQQNNVALKLNGGNDPKVISAKTYVEQEDTLRIEVTFIGNMVYDAAKNWIGLDVNRETPYWPVAGETPWADGVITNYNSDENPNHKDYTIVTEWYKQEDKTTPLALDYQFEAGYEYILRITLKTASASVFATGDLEPLVYITNDNTIGETISASEDKMVVEFPFTVYGGVQGISVEGIINPVAGESVQKNGFTVSGIGATVEFAGWEYNDGSDELFHVFDGDTFENNVTYRLKLKLAPKTDFTLNIQKEDIELNCGEIVDFSRNSDEGYVIIAIDFKIDKEVVNTVSAYITIPQDSQFPNYNATVPVHAGYVVGNQTDDYTLNGVYWHNVTNEEPMKPNVNYFEKGKEYTVTIRIIPTQVAFPENVEDIAATINGKSATCAYENGALLLSYTYVATNEIVNALGDVNNDDKIDAKDALVVLKIAVNKYNPTDSEYFAADVNKDGTISAKDALEILKYAVDKPSCLG